MSQLPILPVVLPLLAGAFLLMLPVTQRRLSSVIAYLSVLAQAAVALLLWTEVRDGSVLAYLAGNWQAPFGIALAVDRLTVFMLGLVAVTALAGLIGHRPGEVARDSHFHALFQFQLMGLNGAFLTADIFNLFVFFEVLLIASYGLLVYGGEKPRVRAGIHYVIANLGGSVLLLLAVALLYGVVGTLNMADLAMLLPQIPAADAGLVRAAGWLLLVVFALKAALLPLYGWLPGTYTAAAPGIAALFAVLTKVGVYAAARLHFLVYPADATEATALAAGPVFLTVGLATVLTAALGTLVARGLARQTTYLVIGSGGTLFAAFGLGTVEAVAAAFYYLVQSTLTLAALFLVAGTIADEATEGRGRRRPPMPLLRQPGSLYLLAAAAAVGWPPLAGFIGKALLIQSSFATDWATSFTTAIIVSSLINILALADTGSRLYWLENGRSATPWGRIHWAATGLLALTIVLAIAAKPVRTAAGEAAHDLLARTSYIDAVLGQRPVTGTEDSLIGEILP